MVRIKAHYDGKVLVPDEPLNVPQDVPLEITVSESTAPFDEGALDRLIELGADVWRGVDGVEYQRKEREGWV